MSSTRTVENPSASVNNLADTGRKFPSTAVADLLATTKPVGAKLGVPTVEKIVGPAGSATVTLKKPVTGIAYVLSYTTATRVASTGGGKVEYPVETTDFTVVKKSTAGVATLTNAGATDYSTETWLVHYYADEAEGTIPGASRLAGNLSTPS